MLVLRRNVDERVIIRAPGLSEPIIVHVLDRGNGKVGLGITAPQCVRIDREEIAQRIDKAKAEALKP
jgi:carbon storage regulator CsrA